MAQKYEQVLEVLRNLDSKKAAEAEEAFEEESLWLLGAITQLKKNLAKCKQPVRREGKENFVAQQQTGAGKATRGRKREALAALDTVLEEEEQEEDAIQDCDGKPDVLEASEGQEEHKPAGQEEDKKEPAEPSVEEIAGGRGRGRKGKAGRPLKPKPAKKAAPKKPETVTTSGRVTRSRLRAAAVEGPEQFPSPPKTRKTRSKKSKPSEEPAIGSTPEVKEEPAREASEQPAIQQPPKFSAEGKASDATADDAGKLSAEPFSRGEAKQLEQQSPAQATPFSSEEAVEDQQPGTRLASEETAVPGQQQSQAEKATPMQTQAPERGLLSQARRTSTRLKSRASRASTAVPSMPGIQGSSAVKDPKLQDPRSQPSSTAEQEEASLSPQGTAADAHTTPLFGPPAAVPGPATIVEETPELTCPPSPALSQDEQLAENPQPSTPASAPQKEQHYDLSEAVSVEKETSNGTPPTSSPVPRQDAKAESPEQQAKAVPEDQPSALGRQAAPEGVQLAVLEAGQEELSQHVSAIGEQQEEDDRLAFALGDQLPLARDIEEPQLKPEEHEEERRTLEAPEGDREEVIREAIDVREEQAAEESREEQKKSETSLADVNAAVAGLPPKISAAIKEGDVQKKRDSSVKKPLKPPAKQARGSASTVSQGPNLVTSHRSLIQPKAAPQPLHAAGKRAPEVDALKAAEAARKKELQREAEREKQKEMLKKQKADRAKHALQVKAKQEEVQRKAAEEKKRREEALRRKEDDAANRRRAREEAEKAEREEKQRRLEESKARKKQEEQKRQEEKRLEQSKKHAREAESSHAAKTSAHQEGNELKRPRVEEFFAKAAALMAPVKASAPTSQQQNASHQSEDQGNAALTSSALFHERTLAAAAAPSEEDAFDSIEIASYKSDGESSEDEDRQPTPGWAAAAKVRNDLLGQQRLDPDELFQQHEKTCPLDEIFASLHAAKGPPRDLSRRTSTGNWLEDRVTWKEEMNYKKTMGYL